MSSIIAQLYHRLDGHTKEVVKYHGCVWCGGWSADSGQRARLMACVLLGLQQSDPGER